MDLLHSQPSDIYHVSGTVDSPGNGGQFFLGQSSLQRSPNFLHVYTFSISLDIIYYAYNARNCITSFA